MKLKCYILILLLPAVCYPQSKPIDSLKTIVSSLTDSSRINTLNKICLAYYVNALSETYIDVATDSAVFYANKAHDEAIKINYTKGVADALQNLGEIARDRNNYAEAEKYFQESIPLFKKINDLERYSWARVTLAYSFLKQCKFLQSELVFEQALTYYVATENKERQSMIFRLISQTYSSRGYNEKAFDNTLKAIRITDKISDARGVISSPENMANLYRNAEEPETAVAYFQAAAANAMPRNPVRYNRLMGEISLLRDKLDSAIYFNKESHRNVTMMTADRIIIERDLSYRALKIGQIYLRQNKFDLAIQQFKSALPFFENGHDRVSQLAVLSPLARCFLARQDIPNSFRYTKRLFQIADSTGARPFLRDAYELYWQLYDQKGNIDSAYKYNLKYIAIKDSILSDEYRRNIALSQMKSQDEQQKTKINFLQKDQLLNNEKLSLQQEKLQSESLVKYILIAITGAILLIGVFIFRNSNLKRKNERQALEHQLALQQMKNDKAKIEFQQRATELEMQALRAQMNPHFIFNCLSSINRFILINKTEEASDYLTKFSRLIRMALHNSEKPLITLENELEALRLYLDLERLRFKNAFNYNITFVNTIDINGIYIPPMLIQPFAENAIWHGLMHKKDIGLLEIELRAENKILSCAITDNGIGRNMAKSLKSFSAEKNKSMGVEITAGRLALLNTSKSKLAVFNIEDLVDEEGIGRGTKVILQMPYKDLTEISA